MNDYGYIYVIINKVNGKTYIGKRKLLYGNWYSDGYLGSGKHLANAKEKYGIENFEKFLICYTSSEEDACEKEKFWISEYRKRGKAEYNISEGGKNFSGKGMKRKGHPAWNKGKTLSEDHIRKLSESHKGNIPGNKGKQGRFWYTNGLVDKIFYPEEAPVGWIKGRCKMKGRVQSDEERMKRSLSYDRSKHPDHFKLTDIQKQNLSNAKRRFYGSIK